MTLLTSAANDAETGEVMLTLARLSHADWADDIRLVADSVDLTHGGQLYLASGFQISMPDQAEDRNSAMRWELTDADNDILTQIITTNDVIDIEVSYVFASAPDIVQVGPFEAEIRKVPFGFGTLSGDLTVYPVMEELANASLRFTTIDYPGLV